MSTPTLQQLVTQRLAELGLSARAAARRAETLLTNETISVIVAGKHSGRLTARVARGLSLALDVPEARVWEAAGRAPLGEPWVMPERFRRLTLPQREVVEAVAAAILNARD